MKSAPVTPGNLRDLCGLTIKSMIQEGDEDPTSQGEGSFDFKVNFLARLLQPYARLEKNREWAKEWEAMVSRPLQAGKDPAVQRLSRRLEEFGALVQLAYDNHVLTDKATPWDNSKVWDEEGIL